jgi:hypothetical protein
MARSLHKTQREALERLWSDSIWSEEGKASSLLASRPSSYDSGYEGDADGADDGAGDDGGEEGTGSDWSSKEEAG